MLRRLPFLRSAEQIIKDMPVSSARKPTGRHRGPHRRKVSPREQHEWQFMKKLQLEATEEWVETEKFRHLPKPKKLYGNEATEIVWPYALLLQNVIRVHPFLKSIYCYYFQHHFSVEGRRRNALARKFARECMIPITFHNSQCYTETEMLLEYGDTPYLIFNCLDERSEVLPITMGDKNELLLEMSNTIEAMCNTAKQPSQLWQLFNDRPIQNGYVKVDYQWMGDTLDERQQHTVNFDWDWDQITPSGKERMTKIHLALNTDHSMPFEMQAFKRRFTYTNQARTMRPNMHIGPFEGINNRQESNRGWSGGPRPYRP